MTWQYRDMEPVTGLIGVGFAVARIILRAHAEQPDLGDIVGDSENLLTHLIKLVRQSPSSAEAILGRAIASDIAEAIGGRTDLDLDEAGTRAATTIARAGANQTAILTALAHPDQFPTWIQSQPESRAQRALLAQHAEPVFDQILLTASTQLVRYLSGSMQATTAALSELLRRTELLGELNAGIDNLHNATQSLHREIAGSLTQITEQLTATPEDGIGLLRLSDQYSADLDLVSVGPDRAQQLRLSDGLYVKRGLEDELVAALAAPGEPFAGMVVGEAGHGKSSLLWSLHRRLGEGERLQPVLISSTWLLPSAGTASVIDPSRLAAAIESLASAPRHPVLLIDTADLLLHDATLRTTLLQLLTSAEHAQVSALLTVRPLEAEWLASQQLRRYRLGPYNPRERALAVTSLAAVFCPEGHPDPVRAIEAAEARGLPVSDVAGNPLTLRMWFEGSAPQFPSVEADVTAIYRLYWEAKIADDLRLTTEPRTIHTPDQAADQSRTARSLARVMMGLGTPEPSQEVALTYLAGHTQGDPTSALLTLTRRGVLNRTGRYVRFFHQTLFEFAAAQDLLADISQRLADLVLQRVLDRPDDLFLAAVLEQYVIIAADDPLKSDWCLLAIEELLRSQHQPLQDLALAAWAHHPGLDVPMGLLRDVPRWAVGRFCRIAPSVSALDVPRVLHLLKVLYDRHDPAIDRALLPALIRLALRAPTEVTTRLREWEIFPTVFGPDRNDSSARDGALTLLDVIAPTDPEQAREATRTVIRWANSFSKRRAVSCRVLDILATHWRVVALPSFLQEVLTLIEDGQRPLDRDSAEVRRSLAGLLRAVWEPHLHEPPDLWLDLLGPRLQQIIDEPGSPTASAGLIAITRLLEEMDEQDPRIEYTLAALADLPPPHAVWEPCLEALPQLLASQTPAAETLLVRLAEDLSALPAPAHVVAPPAVVRAAAARQVVLHPVVSPTTIASLADLLKNGDLAETWTDADRLLALTPRAAVGGVQDAAHALPRQAGDLAGRTDEAIKLIFGTTQDVAAESPQAFIALLAVSEFRSETGAICSLLRSPDGTHLAELHQNHLDQLCQRLLAGLELAQRSGARLLEALVVADRAISITDTDSHLTRIHDPNARAALVRAVGLTAVRDPTTWPQVLRTCAEWASLTAGGKLVGTPRASSARREQVEVVEAVRISWLQALSVKPFDPADADTALGLAYAPSRVGEPTVRRDSLRLLGPILNHWVSSGFVSAAVGMIASIWQRNATVFADNPTTQDKIANDLQPALRRIVAAATLADIQQLLIAVRTAYPKWGVLLVSSVSAVRPVETRPLLQAMLLDPVDGAIKQQITKVLTNHKQVLGASPFPQILAEGPL